MEGPNAAAKVPHSEDLVADINNSCNNDCSCGSSKDSSSISMPICFLVREQAKSFVAIQDLQNRMNNVERVQVDVIDTLTQFRNFLCESANSISDQSPSYLNTTKSPNISSTSKLNATAYHSAFEAPRSILKTSCYSAKLSENVCGEFAKTSIVTVQDHPQKHFDSAKSKDSALESDKQDSGLDSDCREHNEGHPSVRNVQNWVNPDGNDQLLQLLDEISYRSEFLQKQLAVVEDSTILSDMKEGTKSSETSKTASNTSSNSSGPIEANSNCVLEPSDNFSENKKVQLKSPPENRSHKIDAQAVSTRLKCNSSAYGFIEKKSFCEKNSVGKRIGKNIDSSLVSSILKETNLLELQRQTLIYLVDNAVLNTKLREIEHALSCKNVESDKVENSLKEEARLLMMENRELRICLDEQKMETNTLKARVAMLERVLQSITAENQELNWQLGETFNLQHFSKKVPHNLSTSFSFGSPSGMARSVRKSSSLPSQNCRNSNISCGKSKNLSSSSSYLDAMMEEPDEYAADLPGKTYKFRNGPIQSSTPFQRPKSNTLNIPNAGLPNSFQSLKKCLKSNHNLDSEGDSFKNAKSERLRGCDNIPETCSKSRPFPSSHETLNLPMGNVSKFPFSSILEKLKANSEFRLSRSVPTSSKENEVSDQDVESTANAPSILEQQASPISEPKSSQGNSRNNSQFRKSRDIHQRIQNILDRIVAESEEAS